MKLYSLLLSHSKPKIVVGGGMVPFIFAQPVLNIKSQESASIALITKSHSLAETSCRGVYSMKIRLIQRVNIL